MMAWLRWVPAARNFCMGVGAADEEIDDKSYVKLVDINFAQIVVSHALDDVLGGGATVRLVFSCVE